MKIPAKWLLLSTLCAGSAMAQQTGVTTRGPITVTADEAEWQDGNLMRYRGNVLMASPEFSLRGDRLELEQPPSGITAKIMGAPATLTHLGGAQLNGRPAPEVSASASNLTYDAATGWIDLDGDARLTRGADSIDGTRIRYNLLERRIQASGTGAGGQVRIVIQPPPTPEAAP